MKDTPSSMPIKTSERARELAAALRKQNEAYAVLFWLLIGTGAPLSYLLSLKVQDLKFAGQLTFYLRKTSKRPIVSDISLDVQTEIGEYFLSRDDSDPAFVTKDGITPITSSEFLRRLSRTSIEMGYPAPGLNETALRKTYLYSRVFHDKNPQGALDFMGWKSQKKLFTYLGIAKLVKKDETHTKIVIYDDTTIDRLLSDSISYIQNVRQMIHDKNNHFNAEDAMKIITLCSTIKQATTDYAQGSKH